MSKIRINELARQLEVPSHEVIDLLPELGVTEKKTHSSSVDEHVAELVKRHYHGNNPGKPLSYDNGTGVSESAPTKPYTEAPLEDAIPPTAFAPEIEMRPATEPVRAAATAVVEVSHAAPAAYAAPATAYQTAPQEAPRMKPAPIRPPLAGVPAAPAAVQPPVPKAHVAPSFPVRQAAASNIQAPVQRPPAAPAATPTAAAVPQLPASAPLHPPMRSTAIPAKPVPPAAPGPRPGQILSGPRQPLPPAAPPPPRAMPWAQPPMQSGPPPSAAAAPGAPRPGAPMVPARPAPRPQPPPYVPRPSAGGGEGSPQAHAAPNVPLRAQMRPSLAGQPAARPVVPPNPAMLARLQQSRAMPSQPAAPAAPRPGVPTRQSSSAIPGQPIYRGPIRPGQPTMRGPGMPGQGPGGPGAPGARGARPGIRHPVSPNNRVEPPSAIPVTEQQRRHQGKPISRDHRRDQEQEEGRLRAPSRRDQQMAPPPIDREITIADGITVKELSEKLAVKANLLIKKLVEKKIFATINQTLDTKMAELLAREFGASTNKVSYEEETTQEIELAEDAAALVKRAPVVTIMGHVDHGKTSLLDAIRLTHVADKEAGGITQHIGAYYIEKNGRKIVFIDTPGHEAFTRMRARGAKVTDIVVLVVAADDGVMPQTLEAIDHAKAAGVPIIVAINKIDKGDAQPERIKQQLSDRGLVPEEWGGDTVMVAVSAKAKLNLELLLEMILLVTDLQDFKANPGRPAVGTVLEAQLDRGRGPVATVLVRNGTLRIGDYFICGSVFGKVRAMFDDRGKGIREAEPSMPVEVLGLESLPDVGDTFQVVTDTAKAKQIVLYRESKARDAAMSKGGRITLEKLNEMAKEGEVKELNVIVKTDVGGTAEVLTDMMQKLSNEKVRIRVIHSGVGAINETDVLLASASNAIVIGFNVKPEKNAANLAEQEKVDVRLHSIIYDLTDEIKKAMTGMLAPVFREVYQGRVEVKEVFKISKVGIVAGSYVLDGLVKRNSQCRIHRGKTLVHTGKIDTLKRFKDDVSEVKAGYECGVTIVNFSELEAGDIIEAFMVEKVAPEAIA